MHDSGASAWHFPRLRAFSTTIQNFTWHLLCVERVQGGVRAGDGVGKTWVCEAGSRSSCKDEKLFAFMYHTECHLKYNEKYISKGNINVHPSKILQHMPANKIIRRGHTKSHFHDINTETVTVLYSWRIPSNSCLCYVATGRCGARSLRRSSANGQN